MKSQNKSLDPSPSKKNKAGGVFKNSEPAAKMEGGSEAILNAAKAVEDGSLASKKKAELEMYLKDHNTSPLGVKSALVARVTLHVQSRQMRIDNKDPFEFTCAELKAACEYRSLDFTGHSDDLRKRLIDRQNLEDEKNMNGKRPLEEDGACVGGGGGGGGGGRRKKKKTKRKEGKASKRKRGERSR